MIINLRNDPETNANTHLDYYFNIANTIGVEMLQERALEARSIHKVFKHVTVKDMDKLYAQYGFNTTIFSGDDIRIAEEW